MLKIAKICTQCHILQTLGYFHKHASSKDGYHSACKSCIKEYHKQHRDKIKTWRDENKELTTIKNKICIKCKVEQTLDYFHKHASSEDGYHSACKSCKKEYNKQRYLENKDQIDKRNKQFYEENKHVCSIQRKQYREANKESIAISGKQYREANKDAITAYSKQWYEENKDILAIKIKQYSQSPMGKAIITNARHKRRSLTKQGDVTSRQILELQQGATHCAYCQTDLKQTGIHIDHFMPLSKGGSHSLSNLVIACPTCNMRKGAKDPFEFLLELTEKI